MPIRKFVSNLVFLTTFLLLLASGQVRSEEAEQSNETHQEQPIEQSAVQSISENDSSSQEAGLASSSAPTSDYVQRLMDNPENPDTLSTPASSTQLALTLVGLMAVIGMIFVVAWLVRRLSGGQFGHSNAVIKILATQPIGTKERICLIDVGGQQVLVGITAQTMQTLMVLDQPIDIKSEKQGAMWSSSESVNSVFGAKLQSLLKGTPVNEVKKSSQTSSVDD